MIVEIISSEITVIQPLIHWQLPPLLLIASLRRWLLQIFLSFYRKEYLFFAVGATWHDTPVVQLSVWTQIGAKIV